MLKISSLILLVALSAAALEEINPPKAPAADRVLAIVGATLIDAHKGASSTGSVVILRGEKIAEVETIGKMAIPPGAEMFDASGLTLLPGLSTRIFISSATMRCRVFSCPMASRQCAIRVNGFMSLTRCANPS